MINAIIIVNFSPSAEPYANEILELKSNGTVSESFQLINVYTDNAICEFNKNVSIDHKVNDNIHISKFYEVETNYNILAILNGNDSGLEVNEALLLKYFSDKSSCLANTRSSKIETYNFLKSKKLIDTHQCIIDSSNYQKVKVLVPSVLKPLVSVGGRDTFYINTEQELEIVKEFNKPFILQDRVFGEEYSVDIVSCNGKHKLISVWKYFKPHNHHHRDEIDLVDPDKNKLLISRIYEYVTRILNELGHVFGPTHSEIMLSDNSINLIEINYRLHGHLTNKTQDLSLKTNQAREVINLFLFKSDIENISTYKYLQPVKKLLLNNKIDQYIETIKWDDFENLSSIIKVFKHEWLLPGFLKKTTSVYDCLGFVVLSNISVEQFLIDVATARTLIRKICK
jgi:hypothetical protein